MKKLLFFVLLFSISKTISLSAANSCKIIHPEQAIFDFQPGPEEKNDWYIINKDPNRVSALQQDYLSRKLLLANHQYPFSDKAIYAAEQSGEWKKLSCTVLKFFKSKAHSKELLAIVQVEYGDNFWNGQSSSTVLALSTDEYFVFPLSALESYEWPGGKIPKYLLNWTSFRIFIFSVRNGLRVISACRSMRGTSGSIRIHSAPPASNRCENSAATMISTRSCSIWAA